MVNILLVSHSHQIAKSVHEFMSEMKNGDFMFDYIGGIENGTHFGTNPMEIQEKILNMTKDRELVVIYDLGSSLMNTDVALQLVGDEIAKKTATITCAFLEGTLVAVSSNSGDINAKEMKELVESQCKISK
jgi:dihydroxyacetone kinase phosphotransfer subunit